MSAMDYVKSGRSQETIDASISLLLAPPIGHLALELQLMFVFYLYRLQLPSMGASIVPLWHAKFGLGFACYQIPNLQETS